MKHTEVMFDELRASQPPTAFADSNTVPVLVKCILPESSVGTSEMQVVQMSLLCDLRRRLDNRALNADELSKLSPEMADAADGSYCCRPHCMVCLDELEEGQAVSRQECGHTFHHECLATWLGSQLKNKQIGACPHCKHTIVVPVIKRVETPVRVEEEAPPSYSTISWGCFSVFNSRSAMRRT